MVSVTIFVDFYLTHLLFYVETILIFLYIVLGIKPNTYDIRLNLRYNITLQSIYIRDLRITYFIYIIIVVLLVKFTVE